MIIKAMETNTEWPRRVALPLAIGVHILLFMLLNRSAHKQAEPADAQALTMQLIPFLQPDTPPAPVPAQSSIIPRRQAASSGAQKRHPTPGESVSTVPATVAANPVNPESIAETPKASVDEGKPMLSDPSALVQSYGSEYGKSDLQKAIESHGGTVALTKGKYDDFHQQMDFATIPDCMRPDALKHDPPKIGPITVGGQLALLFWVHAAATGKCKLPGASN